MLVVPARFIKRAGDISTIVSLRLDFSSDQAVLLLHLISVFPGFLTLIASNALVVTRANSVDSLWLVGQYHRYET